MEPKNLKREEKPAASCYPLQRTVPYIPATSSPLTQVENARIHQFFSDQLPSSVMSRMTNISEFSNFPNRNTELNSFGSRTSELPQQHCYDKMWTTNMNNSHVEGFPQNSVRNQTVDGLNMIKQGGVKSKGNTVKPRTRQNLSVPAACQAMINEENKGSFYLTFDAFQPKYAEQYGSFLTLGAVNDRLETLDVIGRGVTRGSGSAATVSNSCFQTANGTFMSSMSPSINIVGNSPSILEDARRIGGPYQDLSGWNFVSNPPRIPSNAGVGISPSSFLQHTHIGYQHHPSFCRIMDFSHDVAASTNSNFVNLGHRGFFNTYLSNPVIQGNAQVNFGQNCAKNLWMASLHGMDNTQLASLQQNQATGSGCNQFIELDSEVIPRKNLSVTDLSRHKTRQAFVQQSNESVFMGSSSSEPSLIPHSHSFDVLGGRIKHDQSGAAESKMDQSSQRFQGSSLKRGNIQPIPAAPRAQRRKRVIQSPSQLFNFSTAINLSRPIAEIGPYPSSSSLTSAHNSSVPQLPQQTVPTSPSLASATVPTLPRRALPSLPTTFVPSSLPKNVRYPTPSRRNTSTHHIICEDLNESQPLGENCFLCKRDVSFTPEGPLLKPTNQPPVAVLPCGHAFHDQCLERITPPEQCKNPPCIPCAIGESRL